MQNELILTFVRVNCRGVKFQNRISINSPGLSTFQVLENQFRDRSMLLFKLSLCTGSSQIRSQKGKNVSDERRATSGSKRTFFKRRLLQRSRGQNDGRTPSKGNAPRRTSPSGSVKNRARLISKEIVRICRVITGIPSVNITKLNRDANSAIDVYLGTLRPTVSAAKDRIKVVEKDRLLY